MPTVAIASRGVTLAFDDAGTGLPVVLLHAFPFDRAMWSPQLEEFASAGCRVLALDLPGFGESPPADEPFSIDAAANLVAGFLADLNVTRAVVCGLSMGGYIALAFARNHHAKLAGLILADTKAAPDDEVGREGRNKAIAAVTSDGAAKFAESMLPKLLSETTRESKSSVVALARQIATRQSDAAVVAALQALRDRPDAVPGLDAIAVPTLVLVGEHDTITPALAAARIAGSVRGSELHHIPKAGHLSNIENPAAFNAAAVAFLKKLM